MAKYSKRSSISLTKILELIGKPAFFLFTILVIGVVGYHQLLKKFVQRVVGFFIRLNQGIQTRSSHIINIWRVKRSVLLRKSWPKAKMFSRIPIHFRVRPGQILRVLIPSLICYSFYFYILRDLPSVKLLADSPPSLTTKIYDRNGELLYQIYKDENRSLISLTDLPEYVIKATLSAEDKNFYHHFGVDLIGIVRASLNNLRCSIYSVPCSLQGGSTITQQLIKNTLLTPEKTFTRKIKELILSFETELIYSKDEILEMYLNQVGYGGTAYGIEQAGRQYFGKSARDLSLAESAMLAGLPIAPTILSPWGTNPYLGKIRQQQVLENMVQTKTITENEKVEALSTPLIFHPQGVTIRAPHFVMYIKDLLVKEFGEEIVARGGLEVTTTLDLKKQEILQNEISTELSKLAKLHVQNGAGLIVDPKSGDILAMVGSKNFFDSEHDGQVNIVMQERQPGSSIKPITYALALSNGSSPATTIDDVPVCFIMKGQPDYCPKNYDGRFHGKVTLRTALGSSYNIPAIKLLNTYGIKNMIELAKKLGITTWEDSSRFGLSLTLGGGEITMYDLSSVYSVFASGGNKIPFNSIISVKDSGGNIIKSKSPSQSVEVLSPAVAYQINSILSDQVARSPAFGTGSILNLPGKNIAVKTGTTNNLRDNWTFGYTSDLLVATWVGNNDNTPMSSVASGITGASPIWAHTMQKLLGESPPSFSQPDNIIQINLNCYGKPKYEYFIEGNTPKIDCKSKPGTLLEAAASTSK